MDQQHAEATGNGYPHGRGYGHDYMRGGEVLGGYGYSERPEYQMRRGEITGEYPVIDAASRADESSPDRSD